MSLKFNVRWVLTGFLLVSIATGKLSAQNDRLFSDDELEKSNTAANVDYLTSEEKDVIRYMNLARMDGVKFFNSYVQQFVDRYNAEYTPKIKPNNSYLKSLKSDLNKIKNLPLLFPNEKLCKVSLYHAKDMGKSGNTGHNSSNGNSVSKRMLKFLGTEYYLSENCDYGFDKGLDIVCHLLIDNGVSSLGHRVNMLNNQQRFVGVSIWSHKVYNFNCVIDFYSNPDDSLLR
jgi:hypothetical protein